MINSVKIPRAYSEVYSFLNTLGNYYISKIPDAVYDTIKENRDKNYNPVFKDDNMITKNNISQEGLSLIAAINLQYWCNNPEEKLKLKNIYRNNSKIEKEKYSYDNLFNNNLKQEVENTSRDMIEYKETFLKKIINKIKIFFEK